MLESLLFLWNFLMKFAIIGTINRMPENSTYAKILWNNSRSDTPI